MLLQWLMNILNQAITGSFRQRLGITVAIFVFISVQLLFALLLMLNELPFHLLPQLLGWSILMACCCWLLTWLSARRLILPLLALGETITQIQQACI